MHKIKLLSVFLIVVFIILMFQEKLVETVSETNQKSTDLTLTTAIEAASIQLVSKDKNFTIKNKKAPVIKAFSQDPFINSQILNVKFSWCRQYFNSKISNSPYYLLRLKSDNPISIKYIEDFKDNCEKMNNQHPEYYLQSYAFLGELHEQEPTSTIAKLLNHKVDTYADDFDISSYLFAFSQNDPILLLTLYQHLDGAILKQYKNDLFNILQTQQFKYLSFLTHYGYTLYACNSGADCGVNSNIMFGYCYNNIDFCVIDYYALIETRFTQAQQQDIKLIEAFISQLFDEAIRLNSHHNSQN